MTKYEKISVLAKETARSIGENKESWMNYLDVASRLYKYPFEDQILIYAQRPDATACAPLEMWNEKMFCWVNRGAKGIALIDQESDYPRLRYVFDVFKNRQDVALWWRPHPLMEATFRSMRPEHYAEYEQIVAEYKQAGWGIYDDTPELHRAIAYSDCYYGDGSSVVDLYKVTGKPVMIENYELIY